MYALINHALKQYKVNFSEPLDISIPLYADGSGARAYHAPPFKATPVVAGDFTGLVGAGSPVNFLNVQLNPHGNGTHTECVGHITAQGQTINQCLKNFFFIAELISIYPVKTEDGDEVIFPEQVIKALQHQKTEAVIIRTLPNDILKLKKNYSEKNPPYFHHDAAEFFVKNNVKHLLVDVPSVDREDDGGRLLFHKTFWGYPKNLREDATITEMIFVPSSIQDGTYLLNLQIASFEIDASPSKPVIYKIQEKH